MRAMIHVPVALFVFKTLSINPSLVSYRYRVAPLREYPTPFTQGSTRRKKKTENGATLLLHRSKRKKKRNVVIPARIEKMKFLFVTWLSDPPPPPAPRPPLSGYLKKIRSVVKINCFWRSPESPSSLGHEIVRRLALSYKNAPFSDLGGS